MYSFKQWLQIENADLYKFTSPSDSLASEPGYVYHGTNHHNLYDIVNSGYVDIFDPWHGTEQDNWPDGSTEPRSYWSKNISATQYFIPEGGKPVILRSKFDPKVFHVEKGTKDIYARQKIPASSLEVLVNNEWVPAENMN